MTQLLLLGASLAHLPDLSALNRQADQRHVTVRCVIREGDDVTGPPAFATLSTQEATFACCDAALAVVPSIQEDGIIEITAKVGGVASIAVLPKARLKPGHTVTHTPGGCEIAITPNIEH